MEPVPPHAQMTRLLMAQWLSQAISAAAEIGVADALADGPRDAAALAAATGSHAPSLDRLLRALSAFGVFAVDDAGRFGLTPLGATLRSVELRSFARYIGAPEQREHWSHLVGAVRTGETGVAAVRGNRGSSSCSTRRLSRRSSTAR